MAGRRCRDCGVSSCLQGKNPITSERNANQAKHHIRLAVHEQLKLLWHEHPVLQEWAKSGAAEAQQARSHSDILADDYQRCNMRFLPL
jgi:hypothetical protein